MRQYKVDRVKPSAAIGAVLKAQAIIADGVLSIDSSSITIRGSYDPNDKQATTQLTPSQVASGSYIDYIVRFQNTGTDVAFNIVISDGLSSQLLVNSFELTNSSHPCIASMKENVVFFEFKNILLPDSNANEVKSHGFVQFRIKALPSTPINTTIENAAGIYFDYNQPVITNTAFTVIKNPGQVYTFTGNGNWDAPSNWKNNAVPPPSIQQNEMVIINPVDNGECILNVPVTALPGAAVSVQPEKLCCKRKSYYSAVISIKQVRAEVSVTTVANDKYNYAGT
ncbi:MAG: hypothetical protein IPP72_10150 [Chitinophagaceae bacterium]|nr:hypothetical protein [Chitinophagaceae bacterium]